MKYTLDPKNDLVLAPSEGTYHTTLAPGTPAHPTRDSVEAALCMLDQGEVVAASRTLRAILALQVTDPTDPHFGIWGWYAEEPPGQMNPADWNWADFLGVGLLKILHIHGDQLDAELRAGVTQAVENAAWSIFRRNMGAHYTNIAAMGACVCAALGERVGNTLLVDYGAQRLAALRQKTEADGAFGEYNSPTYSMVLIGVFQDVLFLVQHPQARQDAEWMLHLCWELIAKQFHPGTHQWAGAQSRSYSKWLGGYPAQGIATALGRALPVRGSGGELGQLQPDREARGVVPCPAEFQERFQQLPEAPHEITQIWTRHPDGSPRDVGTTWFSEAATLGSMRGETTWDQRRCILGYWRTAEDVAVRLRMRLLHNGRNFDSGFVRSSQVGPRLLSGIFFTRNGGDWHPHFDVPADGTFQTRDLRVRYEVEGIGARVNARPGGGWELRAGGHRVILHTGAIRLDGREVTRWESGGEDSCVWVDGIFHTGDAIPFNPGTSAETSALAALELLAVDEEPSHAPILESLADPEVRELRWVPAEGAQLTVHLPRRAPTKDEAYPSTPPTPTRA